MSLLTSFLGDLYKVKKYLYIFQRKYIWNFNATLDPLGQENKNHNVAKYSQYIERKYIKPLKHIMEKSYPNEIIPTEIYAEIIESQIGNIGDHYKKSFTEMTKTTFALPIVLGYIQICLIILFCVVNIFAYDVARIKRVYCYSYIKKDHMSLLFAIFILSFIVSLIHLIGIIISYYQCTKYSKVIHTFQIELFQKNHLSFLQNDYNNILFAYIGFQKWLNVNTLELSNYHFLFPNKNIPLLILILSKYWLLTYTQFIIILSYCLVSVHNISAETKTVIVGFGLIQCVLILFYCHLRITFSRTVSQSMWYLLSLLSAILAFLLLEILLIVMLEKFMIYFKFERSVNTIEIESEPSTNCSNQQSFYSPVLYQPMNSCSSVYSPVLPQVKAENNFIFYISNITIYSLINYIPNIPEITLLSDIRDVYNQYESYILEQSVVLIPNLIYCLIYQFIPIVCGILLLGWFYIIERGIFHISLTNIHNLTITDLDNSNIALVGWVTKGCLFDLYYFMPFYRIVYMYLCFIYGLYVGIISGLWLENFDGYLELALLSGILTIVSIVYVYIQQQIHCLMSGLNEYQYALVYITPHSFSYLWKQWSSIILF
eukprot:370386_1